MDQPTAVAQPPAAAAVTQLPAAAAVAQPTQATRAIAPAMATTMMVQSQPTVQQPAVIEHKLAMLEKAVQNLHGKVREVQAGSLPAPRTNKMHSRGHSGSGSDGNAASVNSFQSRQTLL